jgi:hypothetical protein
MADDRELTELLAQLDAIANAPLTGSQREARARPLLDGAGVSVLEVGQALGRAELGWNQAKPKEYGVSPQTWLHAVRAMNLPASQTANDLLYRIYQAEAAVLMLGSGYKNTEDQSGSSAGPGMIQILRPKPHSWLRVRLSLNCNCRPSC